MADQEIEIPEELFTEMEWVDTNNKEYPYQSKHGLRSFEIRINNFPEEPLFTLLENGKALCSFNDWPAAWRKIP